MEIDPAPEEHRKTYEHASLHLAPEAAPSTPPTDKIAVEGVAADGDDDSDA